MVKKVKKASTDGIDVSTAVKGKKKKKAEATREVSSHSAFEKLQFKEMLNQSENAVINMGMSDFTRDALHRYGSYVVEERAIPDFRDGLKPAHRAVLWSLCGLGLRPTSAYKKSARTVGEAIGKYHPHGDMSVYSAMVTVANTMPPIVDGQGNWGTPINPAAAQRYTEARMSKFSHMFLVDPKYLEVVPKIPNFSDDEVIPLYMPALLPYILFNGNVPAPAYGVRAGNPSFSFQSVAKVVSAMLRGEEHTAKSLAKTLKIQHAFGTDDVTTKANYLEMIKTGKGNIAYTPIIEPDYAKRIIRIRCFSPGALSSKSTINKTLDKLSVLKGVKAAYSSQGKKSEGSGPYGALFVVECQKNISEDAFEELFDKVQDETTASINYRLGVTIRHAEKPNAFKYISYLGLLQNWTKYRINLEVRLIKHLKAKAERDLHINEVYLFAVENMEKILKLLPKVLVAADPDSVLAKALGIPVEDAAIILDRKVRQLAKLEAADLKAKIKALKDEIKQLERDLKAPGERAAKDTDDRVAAYLKSPDANKSGLLFSTGRIAESSKGKKKKKAKRK